MKTWQTISILALSVAIAAWGWLTTFRTKAPESEKAASIVSRKPTSAGRTEQAIKPAPFNLARQSEEFSFNDAADKGMNLSFGDDFGFEDEIKEKLSTVLQEIYDQYLAASNREDRKAMLAAIQRLLAKSASGEKLPIWLKQQMIEGIKWVGSSAMPEVIEMAADAECRIVAFETSGRTVRGRVAVSAKGREGVLGANAVVSVRGSVEIAGPYEVVGSAAVSEDGTFVVDVGEAATLFLRLAIEAKEVGK